MNERDKRRVGEQVEPGGREKAPGRLELLQRFINSHNHDFPADWDRLGTGRKAQAWLREKRLISRGERISESDAARLRELREALRALAVANHNGVAPPATAIGVIRKAVGPGRLAITVNASGQIGLEPAQRGLDGAVAALLEILYEAQLSGDWARMKACRQCEYAFYDRSKNRSATWCAMSICGNRTKNRAYYQRRRAQTVPSSG